MGLPRVEHVTGSHEVRPKPNYEYYEYKEYKHVQDKTGDAGIWHAPGSH